MIVPGARSSVMRSRSMQFCAMRKSARLAELTRVTAGSDAARFDPQGDANPKNRHSPDAECPYDAGALREIGFLTA